MSLISRILGIKPAPQPKTYASAKFGQTQKWFNQENKDQDKFELIYKQGGLVSEAIDSYPLFALSNGYRLEGDDENLVSLVQEFLDNIDFDTCAYKAIVDNLVHGKAVQELVPSRDGSQIATILPRPAKTFEVKRDDFGNIIGFEQTVYKDHAAITIQLEKDDVFYLDLEMWILRRAYDDVMRDTSIAEATAMMILRAGFPRKHIKAGQEGEAVPQEALDAIGNDFEELKPDNDLVTCHDVEIVSIDQSGVQNISEYGNWAIQRLSAALGVPEEILGLGRGSTEATANVRIQAFYDKIGTIQKRLARAYNLQVIDRITQRPGAVRIVFNDVSPEDELRKAEFVAKCFAANPIDPIVTNDWARDYLDIEIDEAELEGTNEADKEPVQDEQ